jgi:hypothetical protein
MTRDRMFHVLVLGGIALVGGAEACGGDTVSIDDGGAVKDATGEFPSELPVYVEAGVRDATSEFPSELPVFVDAGVDAGADRQIADARDEFPSELPIIVDR